MRRRTGMTVRGARLEACDLNSAEGRKTRAVGGRADAPRAAHPSHNT